jgi:hypothetical protein
MCAALGLFGGELVAVDGTKIRANNSRKNNHNKTTVERETSRRVAANFAPLHSALKNARNIRPLRRRSFPKKRRRFFGIARATVTLAEIRAALEKLNGRKLKFEEFLTRLETESENEISDVDPDARDIAFRRRRPRPRRLLQYPNRRRRETSHGRRF